jgi:carboxypeptidase family protein/TonB-dependent receptor-like protein
MPILGSGHAFIKRSADVLPLKRAGQLFSSAILTLCIAASLSAQINTATVGGTITDPSGAAVQGATIVVENSATGVRREVQTNDSGVFSVPQLQPGGYQVTVSHEGFRTVKNSDVQVVIDQVANLSITLEVGATQQTVDVTGSAPIIETSTAGLGTVIGHKETVDLPLNGRQFTQLLQLAPGTVPISVSQSATPAIGAGSVTPSINGGTNRSNLFYIDGVYATDPFFGTFSISPSIDALQEFKEQTHTDLAEFGQSTGGSVDVATRAGTNSFHGTAYEFLRNDALDARNFFAPTRGVYRQNQFGGAVGGPILRNKLFFLGFYDGYRYTQAANNFAIVPTQAQLSGDFSGISRTIYDPATYNATTGTIQPFVNNQIPANRINQGVLAYVKNFVPLPNYSGASQNNFLNTEPSTTNQDQGGIRVDYAAGERDNFNGHFMQNEAASSTPSSLPQESFLTGFNGKNAGITWVHTINPTLVGTLTLGYNELAHPQQYQQPNGAGAFAASGLSAGFTDTPGAIKVPMAPGLSANGYFGVQTGWGPIGPQYVSQYAGSISKVAGDHNLKFGASFYQTWMYTNWAQDNEAYNQQATWNPVTRAGGDSFASMLLGLPNSASRQLGNSGVSLQMNVLGLYAQDSWRLTPKLTINYGLRWDYSSPVSEKYNRLATLNLTNSEWLLAKGDRDAPSTLPAGVAFLNRNTLTKPNYMNFSPRLGLAYQVTPKTVVRAGFGIFYDNWAGGLQAAQSARGSWPSGSSQSISNLDIAGVTPGVTAQNPFVGLTPTLPSSPFPSGGTFVASDWQNAYSSQWNLQVQQQVSKLSTLSVGYVGSSTIRSPLQVPFNQARPGPGPVYPRQPYQNMSSPNAVSTFSMIQSVGRANYNSLQARFDQRFSAGLFFITSFTWSKNINIGCASFWEACSIQNPYDLNAERGPSPLDVPLVLTFSPGYELPIGIGKQHLNHGPAAWVLGNWQVNGIFSARSGTVFTPTINFDNANTGGGDTQRPNVVGSPSLPHRTINEWFNTSAFAVAPPFTYGNAGRDSLRGPGYWNVDFSVFRNFSIIERVQLQLRGEFFNVFNHTNFANPSATLGNPNFGVITATSNGPRTIQLALKLNF